MSVDHSVIIIFRQPNQMPMTPWFELRLYSKPLPDQQAFHPLLERARQSMHRGEGRKEDRTVTHLLIWPVTQEQDWDTLTPLFGAGSQNRYPAQAKRSTSPAKRRDPMWVEKKQKNIKTTIGCVYFCVQVCSFGEGWLPVLCAPHHHRRSHLRHGSNQRVHCQRKNLNYNISFFVYWRDNTISHFTS